MGHEHKARSALATTQASVGIVDAADVLVKIEKHTLPAPQPRRYTNICVLATKKTGGRDLDGVAVSDASTVMQDIDEYTQLNFTGMIKLWNVALTPAIVQAMRGYAESVVVLSGRTADVQTTDFGDMIVWLTETAATTSLDAIALQPYRGVMIDPDKQGKLLYALSALLSEPLRYTNDIVQPAFHGVNDVALAHALDDAGYSYFFKARDRTWLRGFWLGGQQARAEYADRSVRYDVKQAVAAMIAGGVAYTDANLALIEARILQTLKRNRFVDHVYCVSVPRNQKDSDKVRGRVIGISVQYATAQEVRHVYIKLGGSA